MCREYFGIITSISENPPKNPQHYCVEYRENGGPNRIFTIPISKTLRGCFSPSAKGKSIAVTMHPNHEPAIIDINGEMAYPLF